MSPPLTGQLGLQGSQPGLIQLGGPGIVQSFTRQRPASMKPLIAHVYESDGVTFRQTLGPLAARPPLHWTSNGSYDRMTLELPTVPAGSAYGTSVYGIGTYGGLSLGHIVKLTEQDGDRTVVYTGIVEAKPDVVSPTATRHEVLLSPIAFELDDTVVSLVYARPTDIAQMVRDAVDATAHLSCDQVSVPQATGIVFPQAGGVIDFTNRFAKEVLDIARSMAGPTWYWYVGPDGRVWFQAMGSTAAYTLRRGVDYAERTGAGLGGSIEHLKNDILVVGGVPPGGSAPVSARYQSNSFGLDRGLQQPISLPSITDQPTIAAVAASAGVVLDRAWLRVQLKVLGTFGQPAGNPLALGTRISMEQPGGAMVRFWEPNVSPLPESGTGSGGYIGPFLTLDLVDDGATQVIAIGDVPVTDSRDLQYLGEAALKRALANVLLYTPAALNSQGVVSGSGGLATAPNPPAGAISTRRWVLDRDSFRAYDGTPNNYGAPSGPGVAVEITADGRLFLGGQAANLVIDDVNGVPRVELGPMPARGASPAQTGLRVNDVNAVPIFDTNGLMQVMATLVATTNNSLPGTIAGSASDAVLATGTFTLNRALSVLMFGLVVGSVTTTVGGPVASGGDVYLQVTGQSASALGSIIQNVSGSSSIQSSATLIQVLALPAGTYTVNLFWRALNTTRDTLLTGPCSIFAFKLGS